MPCFTLVRRYGGQAVAVYHLQDATRVSFRKCWQLSAHTDRVRHIAPADFRANSHLRFILEEMITEIADGILRKRRAEVDNAMVSAPAF